MSQTPPSRHRWWLLAAKVAVAAAVIVAVSSTLQTGINELAKEPREINIGWLIVAGLLYLSGSTPMAWFWWRTLAALGQRPNWLTTLYAYFFGHLGKYVPGKALVVVIRVGILRRMIGSVRLTMASVLLETLTLMAVGAALGAVCSGFALHLDSRVTAIAVLAAVVAGLPTLPPIARRLAGKAAAEFRAMADAQEKLPDAENAIRLGITLRLLASGWLAAAACWTLWSLSLWAVLRSIGANFFDPIRDLPLLIATVSLSVVGGFVSLLPGGLLVRDALLLELLSPTTGPANALLAAILLRLVWLVSELGICGILETVRRGWGLGLPN